MKRLSVLIAFIVGVVLLSATVARATSQSPNYRLDQYSFGSGGTTSDTSNGDDRLFGNTGELEGDSHSDSYALEGGAAGQSPTQTPLAPTVSNDNQYYDRIAITLNPGTDPADTTYAIAISADNFVSDTRYVSASDTLTDTLSGNDWQTYSDWGGSSGLVVTGLDMDTTYTVKVKAIQGDFSESAYSPTAQAATVLPTLTFTVSGPVNMGTWQENNNYTTTANGSVTTSTNAFNGYNVYAFITGPLSLQGGFATIPAFAGTYASPRSWTSGTGFGYTTNDPSIGGVDKWDADPCPGDGGSPLCYAAFSLTGPGDVVVDHEIDLGSGGPIVDEEFTITYKVATTATQAAGTYSTSVVYTVAPIY